MSARRSIRKRDWPRGLYETRPGYYVWRHPDPKHVPFQYVIGRVDLQFAKDESNDANNRISATKPSLGDRVMGGAHTLAELLGKMPVGDRGATTKHRRALDKRIKESIGTDTGVHTITVADCAKVLQPLLDESKMQMALAVRSRMISMFKKAMALGWVTANPAAVTEVPTVDVLRDRMVLPQYQAIAAVPMPDWLTKAMGLLMVAGQDRDTVIKMHTDMLATLVEPTSGVRRDYLVVQRGKTRRTNQPVAIPLDITLRVLGLRLRDLTAGAAGFLVHEAGEPINADRLTRAFTDARRAAGIPDVMPNGKLAPTFYEIKSLSKRLYKAQRDVDTERLFSHTSQTDALYADPRGTEPVFVAWSDAG